MFNLFKKKNKFKTETENGNIFIQDNQLFYDDNGYTESVNLSILKYAYVEFLGDNPYLYLFDSKQNYIPILQKGFSLTYPKLSERFGFDDAVFFKTLHSKNKIKERIWIEKFPKNFEILEKKYTDYSDCFEVQTKPPTFISWDATYEEILKLNIGHLYLSELKIYYFKIDFPVRIGSLIINEFEFYYDPNERTNIAVQSYFTSLNTESLNDESYYQLRKLWMNEIPTDIDDAGYEREDQKYLNFNLNEIILSICYTYDLENQYEDGKTSLTISNYRDYSESILKNELTLDTKTTKIINFETLLNFQPNYKTNSKVIALPNLLKEYRNAVWVSNDDTFGFTGDQFAIKFHKNEIENIVVQNVLPAKGEGYVEIFVRLKTKKNMAIYYGDQNSFDKYIEPLEKLLQIKVEVPEPYYNC